MSESWRGKRAFDDTADASWVTAGAPVLQPSAALDRRTWRHFVELLDAVGSKDRAEITRAMDRTLGLPVGRRVALKRCLKLVNQRLASLSISETPTDTQIDEVAQRLFPSINQVLDVPDWTIAAVLGDSFRVLQEDIPTYSVPEGEFILVAAVIAATQLAETAGTTALDLMEEQCRLSFADRNAAGAEAIWGEKRHLIEHVS